MYVRVQCDYAALTLNGIYKLRLTTMHRLHVLAYCRYSMVSRLFSTCFRARERRERSRRDESKIDDESHFLASLIFATCINVARVFRSNRWNGKNKREKIGHLLRERDKPSTRGVNGLRVVVVDNKAVVSERIDDESRTAFAHNRTKSANLVGLPPIYTRRDAGDG